MHSIRTIYASFKHASQIFCTKQATASAFHIISPIQELSPHAQGLHILETSNAENKNLTHGCTRHFCPHTDTAPHAHAFSTGDCYPWPSTSRKHLTPLNARATHAAPHKYTHYSPHMHQHHLQIFTVHSRHMHDNSLSDTYVPDPFSHRLLGYPSSTPLAHIAIFITK